MNIRKLRNEIFQLVVADKWKTKDAAEKKEIELLEKIASVFKDEYSIKVATQNAESKDSPSYITKEKVIFTTLLVEIDQIISCLENRNFPEEKPDFSILSTGSRNLLKLNQAIKTAQDQALNLLVANKGNIDIVCRNEPAGAGGAAACATYKASCRDWEDNTVKANILSDFLTIPKRFSKLLKYNINKISLTLDKAKEEFSAGVELQSMKATEEFSADVTSKSVRI